ncbi:MAG: DNA polymerase III subunit beta [Treponema sp.]|jgi:DNA polymerase-3 subunit beta|nr:DNA polymerase III subunit beta [Treponema sp.]
MEFKCERSVILNEVTIARDIVISRSTDSILSYIFLDVYDGFAHLKATDMKVSFETSFPVTVTEPGTVTVFSDKLLAILNTLPEAEITVIKTESHIIIQPSHDKKKIKFQLKCIAQDSFPELPQASAEKFFDVPVSLFKFLINQTIFSVSSDESRYFMTGLWFSKTGNKFIMVATDGRRMAYTDIPAEESIPDFDGITVPKKILEIVRKYAGDEGLVSIAVTDRLIFIKIGSYQWASTLIEGAFPNWQRVIPEHQDMTVSINRSALIDAIKHMTVLLAKEVKIYFKISPAQGEESAQLSVYIDETEVGVAEEKIECSYTGTEETIIAVNYHYVADPIKVLDSPDVQILFTDPAKAITLKAEPETTSFHIIMPIQR